MPIYEFKCSSCGTISELLVTSGENAVPACRKCGSPALERILSAAAILRSERKPSRGHTCCGREERCQTPPCSTQGGCHHG